MFNKPYVPLNLNSTYINTRSECKVRTIALQKTCVSFLSHWVLQTFVLVMFQRPPHGFLPSMRLEAVDRRNPRLIRVATVIDVDDQRVKVPPYFEEGAAVQVQACPSSEALVSWHRGRRKLALTVCRDCQLTPTWHRQSSIRYN